VASLRALLSQRGSSVLFGELLLVPIGNSILYVRPLYVQAEGDSTVPELERVIVAVGEQVVMANSLQEALEELTRASLDELFRGISTGSAGGIATDGPDTGTGTSTATDSGGGATDGDGDIGAPLPDDLAGLVADLVRLQSASAAALAEDPADWAEFGRLQARMQKLMDALEDMTG